MNILRWSVAGLIVLLVTFISVPIGAISWLVYAGTYLYQLGYKRGAERMGCDIVQAFQKRSVGKKTITGILIACLLFSYSPHRAKGAVQECNALVVGGIVIAIGAVVVYKVIQFCKKYLPPPPGNNTPPPTPQPTNAPPATTNSAASAMFHFTFDGTNPMTDYDVSTNGWMDFTVATNPVPFTDFFVLTLGTSTNLTDWTNMVTVKCWLSANSMESVLYDARGKAVATNWSVGNPFSGANAQLPFELEASHEPARFFK